MTNLQSVTTENANLNCGRYGGVIPAATAEAAQPAIGELNSRVGPLVEQYVAALEKIKLKEGIRLVMAISAAGNKFFQVRMTACTVSDPCNNSVWEAIQWSHHSPCPAASPPGPN